LRQQLDQPPGIDQSLVFASTSVHEVLEAEAHHEGPRPHLEIRITKSELCEDSAQEPAP
jgi:hypothetical protein